MDNYKEIATHCRKLGLGEVTPIYTVTGLCYELGTLFKMDRGKFRELARSYPNHSGNSHYPIPAPDGSDPEEVWRETENLWIGEYGEERKRFCLWLANEIEKEYAK